MTGFYGAAADDIDGEWTSLQVELRVEETVDYPSVYAELGSESAAQAAPARPRAAGRPPSTHTVVPNPVAAEAPPLAPRRSAWRRRARTPRVDRSTEPSATTRADVSRPSISSSTLRGGGGA